MSLLCLENRNIHYISAFDLDKTLLKVNCSFEFGRFLYLKRELSLFIAAYLVLCYFAHSIGVLGLQKLNQFCFNALVKNKQFSVHSKLVNEFLDGHLQSYIYQPAFTAYQKAKKEGHFTALLSNSPDFIVTAIAERLLFDFVASSSYLVSSAGTFESLGKVMTGNEKACVLSNLANQLHVSKENIYAYSDSHLDLPFLEAAGHPIAVRPNGKLRKISIIRGWRILHEKSTLSSFVNDM